MTGAAYWWERPGPHSVLGRLGDTVAEGTDNLALNDGQKTRLLNLALEGDSPAGAPNKDEQKGDLLRNILRCALPLEAPASSTAVSSGPSYGGLRTVAGPPLGELLLNRTADVVVLKCIKEYAKALGKNAKSGIERDVFLAVYFAAIAAALVFHAERITEHFEGNLAQFLRSFANAAWIPTDLVDLFRKAISSCQEAKTASDA